MYFISIFQCLTSIRLLMGYRSNKDNSKLGRSRFSLFLSSLCEGKVCMFIQLFFFICPFFFVCFFYHAAWGQPKRASVQHIPPRRHVMDWECVTWSLTSQFLKKSEFLLCLKTCEFQIICSPLLLNDQPFSADSVSWLAIFRLCTPTSTLMLRVSWSSWR